MVKEEFFKAVYDEEVKDFEIQINKDLIDKFGVTYKQIQENVDYNLMNEMKDNLIEVLRSGEVLKGAR